MRTNTEQASAFDGVDPLIMPRLFGYSYTMVDTALVYDEHVHHDHEVIFVDFGTYHCLLNDVALTLEANDLLVVKPGDRHIDSFEPPLRCIAIKFRLLGSALPSECQSLFIELIRSDQQVVTMPRDEIVPLIARMREEAHTRDSVSAMIRDALLREFFWRMVRAFGPEVISPAFMRSSDEHSWHLKLHQLMTTNREYFPSVAEMAGTLGVSERTLTNWCRRVLNQSPSRALMHYKLGEAMAMVTQTSMPVQPDQTSNCTFRHSPSVLNAVQMYTFGFAEPLFIMEYLMTALNVPIGIQSWCFREFKTNAEVAKVLKSCGVDNIELCGVHADFNSPEANEEAVATYKDYGVTILSTGVNDLNGEEAHDRPLLEFLKLSGAKYMSVHLPVGIDRAALERIHGLLEEYDVRVGIHNHGGSHWLGSPEILRYLFSITGPRIGLWMDTAWALDAGADPVKMANEFGERLYGVHIKDFTFDTARRPTDVVVGTGNLDLPGLTKALVDHGFSGCAIIEYEGDAENPVPALTLCVQEVKKAFAG
jgi:sugar phosphate isomerase/epimerase